MGFYAHFMICHEVYLIKKVLKACQTFYYLALKDTFLLNILDF